MPCGPICPASDALCIAGLRATAHAADPWSVPGVGGYRIEEFFFPMAILAYIDRHITYIIGIYILASAQIITECIVIRSLESIKKQQFYRPWDASPASKTIGKCPLEAQFRNTWTSAGFQPKACKTQARKTLRTLPLPVANVPLGGTVPKHSNTSRIRAQGMQNTSQKNLSERYLWNP